MPAPARRSLSPQQFPEDGLFPADHPAMAPRTPAQMSPEQYQTMPGAWHHGTYRAALPDHIPGGMSEGVHFGSLKSAQERLNDHGPRNLGEMPHAERNLVKPDAPAEIHVRRLAPDHGKMKYSPENPGPDRGEGWDEGTDAHPSRFAHSFGEYYKNDAEDIGSVSLRVPSVSGYMESHRGAVSRAIREGASVHPTTKGLLENHGGQGIDEPIPHKVEPTPPTPQAAAMKRDEYKPEADHDTLLPYTLVGSGPIARKERVPGSGMSMAKDDIQFGKTPAVTFTATKEEADKMSPDWSPTNLRGPDTWRKAYRE